jgi:hypothetical protein
MGMRHRLRFKVDAFLLGAAQNRIVGVGVAGLDEVLGTSRLVMSTCLVFRTSNVQRDVSQVLWHSRSNQNSTVVGRESFIDV